VPALIFGGEIQSEIAAEKCKKGKMFGRSI
jgi:hypothetical protein